MQHLPLNRSRRLDQVLMAMAIVTSCAASAPLPLRLALVIGNGHYAFNDPLPNALSDARKLAEQLTRMGFTVQQETYDLDKDHLSKAVTDFSTRLRESGPNSVGFFYYAGHAAQDSFGVNFMLPVNAQARDPDDVRAEGTPLQPLLQAMEDANNPVNIVVLDACRSWYPSDSKAKDPKGLHDMGQHASMLIAYATRANDTADEGAAATSSPFSRRLIEALQRHPGDPIVLMFDDVKTLVYTDTDAGQAPLLVNGLTISGRWSFKSGAFADVANNPKPTGSAKAISRFLASLDRARLVKFFRGRESLADALLKQRDVLERFEIDTPDRLAYFLGSIAFETGGFKYSEEKFGFSAEALRRTWPQRVKTDGQARQLAGDPVAIANVIYANKLGNGSPESGDGWRFRGRGVYGFFITGRLNYQHFGKVVGIDLLAAPELVNDLEIGLAVSAAVWHDYKANAGADANSVEQVMHRLRTPNSPAQVKARSIWVESARRAIE